MKKILLLSSIFLAVTWTAIFNQRVENQNEPEPAPNDYLWAQRAFPNNHVPSEAFYKAIDWAASQPQPRGVTLNWVSAGPTNVGGRITDLAMHASDQQTIYAATATGGVWKSTDAGQNWAPVSDNLPSLSIGDIAIDPSDKNTIFCGTGEPNAGGGSITYDGKGIFKSTDGGASWSPSGLQATGSIGRIEVDPRQPNRIFVAAMGHLFENNPDRGVYRSLNGGATWERNLFVNDSVGFIDLAMNPLHPDTVFAVAWERVRRPSLRTYGGLGSAIYRSFDGGETWSKLSAGLPSGPNIGRMGIAIAPSNPDIVYVTVAHKDGAFLGIYKSANGGNTWTLAASNPSADPGYSSYGWWFGQVRVHPNNPNHLYNLGIDWLESSNGGATWAGVSDYLHADYHAFYIHPANPEFQIVGNDGGIFISENGGANWEHRPLPITQFYTAEIDFQNPESLQGGAQDNGTWKSFGNGPEDWIHIFGGDGFVTLVNPNDPNLTYSESQYGGFAGTNGASAPTASRYNWNTPYIFDPNDPDIMYFGTERLFRSEDGGLSWTPISSDMSTGTPGQGGVVYGTITTIAASKLDENVLITGTDDGNVWTTSDGGANWDKVSASLPKRWISRVVTDLFDTHTAFVCLSGFRYHDDMAHIYKTTDLGQTWTNVSGNLPDIPVNDLILDPLDPNVWYIATDAGVFSTTDSGANWMPASIGLPTVPVLDLTFHAPTRTLVAATFGRSMFRTAVPVPSGATEPVEIGALNVSPNPFSNAAEVSFVLFKGQNLAVDLFDISGKKVKSIFQGNLPAGKHQLNWSGNDLPPGVYFLRLNVPGGCRKMVKSF